MSAFFRTIIISLQLILVTSVLSVGFGFIKCGEFTLAYVIRANLAVGTVITCFGILMKLFPAFIKYDDLTDHSYFIERYYAEQYYPRQEKAFSFLFLGLSEIIITGAIQLVLSAVISR